MKNQNFLLIPLQLIRDFIHDPDTISKMYHVGIYNSALELKGNDEEETFRSFIYCLFRCKEDITQVIWEEFGKMIDFPADEGSAFDSEGHCSNPDAFEYLEKYCSSHRDFYQSLQTWNKVRSFYKILNLDKKSLEYTIKQGKEYSSICSKGAQFLLNSEVMFNIYQNKERMRSDERAVWAMYFGILSIIGRANFSCTTSSLIQCRMFGALNEEELKEVVKDGRRKTCFEKFRTKFQYRKLLETLQDRDMVSEMSLKRRTYISVKAKTPKELTDMIIQKEIDLKKKRQRDQEKKDQEKRFYKAMKEADEASTKKHKKP